MRRAAPTRPSRTTAICTRSGSPPPSVPGRSKRIESSVIDDLFGQMRREGLSASRLNQAKALYAPFFRWAKRRGMTLRNPMVDFEMPTSTYRSKERTPPEVEELTLLLATAVEVTPEIAPLLVLGAVTGTRRGELVAIPRSAVAWKKNQITVDTAISSKGKVKSTKTRRGRTFHVDAETIAMLQRHCDHMDERARAGRRRTRSRSISVQPRCRLLKAHAARLLHQASRRTEGLSRHREQATRGRSPRR